MTNDETRMTNATKPTDSNPWVCLSFVVIALLVSGCSSYRLRGIVVSGARPEVRVVSADDPVLQSFGVAGATLELTTEPLSMNPVQVAATSANGQGAFDIPVDLGGAGVLDYEVGVLCRAPGYGSVWQTLRLPPGNRRLLIVMAPGGESSGPDNEALRESLEFHRQMQGP